MTISPEILSKNAEQLARPESLVATGPNFLADLGGDWTVAVAFAHMAFWDRRQAELLKTGILEVHFQSQRRTIK